METDSLSYRLQVIQPVLLRFLNEKKEIEESAKRDGKIPEELCKLCSDSSRLVKTTIHPLKDEEVASLSSFLKWMEENKITSVKGLIYSGTGSIEVEAKEPIGKRKPTVLEKGAYHYSYPLSELKKRPFYSSLISKFDGVESCPHFDPSHPRVVRLFQQGGMVRLFQEENVIQKERVANLLFFCCDQCVQEKEKLACDRGITKQGFIYSVNCDLNGLVLEKILKEENIEYEKGERRESLLFFPHEDPIFFLRKLEVLIKLSVFPKLDETIVSVLKPKLIVYSGKKATVVELLAFNTDVLIVSDEGFYIYDHTKTVEESLDAMINHMVDKLEEYAEKARGNDHDRLIMAFEKIGQELGYVPQREHGKSGLRVDCVWYDRQGKIKVAIEVETAGGWKKDILSTWELEPQLSVIATFQKTDSVPQALLDFSLMKSIPHKLLYLNMTTKNAYLFEKQEIVKKYSLKKEEGKESLTFEEV